MKKISIIDLSLSNFLSFIDEKITFPLTSGFRLLSGDNRAEPRLGANGAGKSSIFEGIFFALYGTGIKGKKISSLLRWSTTKLEVALTLLINDKKYIIKRYGPPQRLELDGKAVEQEDINNLIGISKERFIHSVIFGQGVKLFPDLTIPERVDLFDEVLDLSVWSRCLDSVTKKCSEIDNEINTAKSKLAFIEGKLQGLQSEEQLKQLANLWDIEHQNKLNSIDESINKWELESSSRIQELETRIENWKANTVVEIESFATKIDELESEKKQLGDGKELRDKLRELDDEIFDLQALKGSYNKKEGEASADYKRTIEDEKLWSSSKCPSCSRVITDTEKKQKLDEIKLKKTKLEETLNENHRFSVQTEKKIQQYTVDSQNIRKELSILDQKVTAIEKSIKEHQKMGAGLIEVIEAGKTPWNSDLSWAKSQVNPFLKERENLINEINPYSSRIESNKKERENLLTDKKGNEEELKNLDKKLIAATYWKSGFKRIRLFFVQQILNALQLEIKASLGSLGLDDWNIKLSTETETKSGTTKLGIQIKVQSRTAEAPWEAWSGGEAQRLRISIALGLSNLIQRSSGSFFDFLVLDEPTSWLSPEGIEDMLESLYNVSREREKAVWVIDHRALPYSSFDEIWSVTKDSNGSKISKVV